jgi:cytochrome c biogenesis protein CcmG/thiol:disulfide interchange protein DsbE
MKFKHILIIFIVLWLNAALFTGWRNLDRNEPASPLLEKTIPEFSLPIIGKENQFLTKDSFKDKKVFLNFFASWCKACVKEHPDLIEISKTHALPYYGIAFKDDDNYINDLIGRFGNPFDLIAADYDGLFGISLGIMGLPYSMLIDENGTIIAVHRGVITERIFNKKFLPLLKDKNL